jgi:hypothetical protein
MNGVNKVTVSIRQNGTSVFLIGDIYDPTTKGSDLCYFGQKFIKYIKYKIYKYIKYII